MNTPEFSQLQLNIDEALGRIRSVREFTYALELVRRAKFRRYPIRERDYILRVQGELHTVD